MQTKQPETPPDQPAHVRRRSERQVPRWSDVVSATVGAPRIRKVRDRGSIFVVVPNGFTAANLLRTSVLPRLLERQDLDVVLVSPLVRDATFVREFSSPRTILEVLPPHEPAGLEGMLWSVLQARALRSVSTETIRIKLAGLEGTTGRKRSLRGAVREGLARLPISTSAWFSISDRLVQDAYHTRLFARYRPRLVVVATPGLILTELPVLRVAARLGVPTVAADISWDNLTNKLVPIRRLTRLVVWNDILKQQAVALHGYRSSQIDVAGPPQFDLYTDPGQRSSRSGFFGRLGVDPAKRLVTVATTPPRIYPGHPALIAELHRAIVTGKLPNDVHVLVRLHPRDELQRYAEIAHFPNVTLEKPFRGVTPTPDNLDVDISLDSRRHLADTLFHSSVIINAASTISIEACVFDTPVINIVFDADPDRDYFHSVRRYYDFTHYLPIVRSGGIALVDSPADLVEWTNRYLENPSLHRDGRARIVEEQCGQLDGQAGNRVADFLLTAMSA